MSKMKTEFKWFTITEHEEEQEYLRKMNQKGWKLSAVSLPGIYRFEKCEPEDVVYQLDYNQEGIAHKAEYTQMFADCGWEHLLDYAGYSYFRKPASELKEDEGIFCDDNSRLEMIQRVFRGRMIPLLIIFFLILIPNLFLQYSNDGIGIMFWLFTVLFVMYLIIFVQFGIQYYHYRKKISSKI